MRSPLILLLLLAACAGSFAQNTVFVLNPPGHSGRIQGILVTPDQQTLITFGADKSICTWDVKSGQMIRKRWLDIGTGELGSFIDMSIDRSGVVALARINSEGKPVVNIIDIISDRILGTFEGFSHDLAFVRIDPSGHFIITGTKDEGNVYSEPTRLWKIPNTTVPFTIAKATAQIEGMATHDVIFYNKGSDMVFNTSYGPFMSLHINYDPAALPEYSMRKQDLPIKRPGHMGYSFASNKALSVTHHGEVVLFDGTNSETLVGLRKHWTIEPGDSSSSQVAINPSGTAAVVYGAVHDRPLDFLEIYDLKLKKKVKTVPGWFQSIEFISDTTFASETETGFAIYNIISGKSRTLLGPRGLVKDNIGYGAGSRILFDSTRVFDFEKLEVQQMQTPPQGFSAAKMSYHGQALELTSGGSDLKINGHFKMMMPFNSFFYGRSYLNDGRLITGRLRYRSYSNYILLYDLQQPVDKETFEPFGLFEGAFGTITSVAPSPDLESSMFAVRDKIGAISLFDANGPSTTIFKNLLRQWPFVRLNLDVSKNDPNTYALPKEGYTGTLKKGDKLESINGFKPGNKEAIIRYLETLDPTAPVDIEMKRGALSIHSTEKLSTLQSRKPLLSFVPLENNEWLCWSPQGYYAASTNGERWGGWVINKGVNAFAEFHPIYDFKKQFYRPDLVKMIARHSSLEKAVREFNETATQPLSLAVGVNEKLPPSITWVSPATDTTVSKSTVRFVASVFSSSKLQSAKILLNGRTVLRRDQISIRQERETPRYIVSFDLDLPGTDNTINIFAENENGTTLSLERVLKMNSVETGIEKYKPNLYLLSVGVSKHTIPAYALNYADVDARSVEEVYKSQQGTLFKNVFTRTLVNDQATRTGILDAFYWLEQNATQKDVVVIFIASHGLNDKDRFYILPYDGDPDRIRITGVDWSNFADVLGNLPSKVLVFVDACHSGKLGTNILTKRGDTDLMEAIRALATEENGVVIMAASTGKESSLESPEWGHGAFTLALLEGLGEGKADLNGDEIINIREIDYYVADRVKSLTNGRQHPTTQKPSVVSEFPLVMKRK